MIALVASIALALLPQHSHAAAAQTRAAVPSRAVLVQGESLGGLRLGSTPAQVRSLWGTDYQLCDGCPTPTWFYWVRDTTVGAGVKFNRSGRVVAVFTLGSPFGWKTREGLPVGAGLDRAVDIYDWKGFHVCRGYAAMSTTGSDVVTSIYIHGEIVYGFALTALGEAVCQ